MIEIEENSGLVTSKSYKIGIFLDYHNQEIGINELRYDQHFDYEWIAKSFNQNLSPKNPFKHKP